MEAKSHNCITREEKKKRFILANSEEGKSYSEILSTKQEDRIIVKMSLKDYFDTATSIFCTFCEQTGKPFSWKTVFRRLNKEKLVTRIAKKNQKVRLDFAT